MNTSLVTPDGFPRSDIDVAQVRATRTQIIRSRNDLKTVMASLEKELHLHYARIATVNTTTTTAVETLDTAEGVEVIRERTEELSISPPPPQRDTPQPILVPFATVNSVAPQSPSATAVCLFSIFLLTLCLSIC